MPLRKDQTYVGLALTSHKCYVSGSSFPLLRQNDRPPPALQYFLW